MSNITLIPRLRCSDSEHIHTVIGDISTLLRLVGLPVPQDIPQQPGEPLEAVRVRRLEPLQPLSRIWEKHLLNRLASDQLDVAEAQIIEAAYHHAMDLVCAMERLFLEGNDAAMIARSTGVPLERVLYWAPWFSKARN